jgi:Tfp pilus assembly protein PilF
MRRIDGAVVLSGALLAACATLGLGAVILRARAVQAGAGGPPRVSGHRSREVTAFRRVTFDRDVAPLIYKYCSVCHHAGGSGPFTLLTYSDARDHGHEIVSVTSSHFMPPWLPATGYGDFVGQRYLTKAQIETLKRWVEEGEPEGDPRDLPPAPRFPAGWQLGKPDLVLKMAQPYTLQPSGWDVYRNFVLPVPITKPRYVRAIEIRPGIPRVIHHCNILVDPTRSLRSLRGVDGRPGFPGMDLRVASDVFDPAGQFLFWKPGAPPYVDPPGMSWQLSPGTDLILNVHMLPSGKPETFQASVGIYFTKEPPSKFPILIELEHDSELDIPPNDKDFVVTDQFTLPMGVYAYGVYPHAHYLGKDLKGWATLPDGRRKWLLWIRHWNPYWQGVYRYVKPIYLPRGTVLHMRYTYDNSSDNPLNPNRLPRWVRSGNRASDEMGHLWIQVVPRHAKLDGVDSRMILQEALMRHWLAKYPDDFVAHYNLASVFQAEGRSPQAVLQYQAALEARPRSADVENALGTVFETEGKLAEAIAYYRRAIAYRPDYTDPHYNLGICLLAQGNDDDARVQFERVLRLLPGDARATRRLAEAFSGLAAEYYDQGLVTTAVQDLRKAIQLNPADADVRINLGTVLARQGDLAGAVACFKQALEIDPHNVVAQRNLELARSILSRKRAGAK